jgi:hypothetical protein
MSQQVCLGPQSQGNSLPRDVDQPSRVIANNAQSAVKNCRKYGLPLFMRSTHEMAQ